MRWRNEMGEFRIRLVDEEPETIMVSVEGTMSEGILLGGAMLRVRPLADLEFDDPETARVLSRVRERRAAQHPAEVSAED